MHNPLKKEDKGFEAFPAVVVADKTDHLGKRLGKFALWLLVLFFAIDASIQSARNGRLLESSARERGQLINSTERMSRTLDQQSKLIIQLQDAIRKQNDMLREAGLDPVGVPNYPRPKPGVFPTPYIPSAQPSSKPSKSKPDHKPQPNPTPTPSPSPTPDPITIVRDEVCRLTGICLRSINE